MDASRFSATLRPRLRTVVLAALALICAVVAADAGEGKLRGVALVIGQSSYASLPALGNPANDARAIDGLLTELGFDVVTITDADRKKLRRSLARFVEDAEDADVALLYYSGHGIEAGGDNFLVPVDATVSSLDAADEELAPLSDVLSQLQETVPVSIVLLDACRNNPFPPGAVVKQADGSSAPAAGAGLGVPRSVVALAARAKKTEGLGAVIGFAAAPGQVALDGDPNGNSPYAAALLKHLGAGGFPLSDVMTMVTEEVYLKTGAHQLPWTNSSLRRALFFGRAPDSATGRRGADRGRAAHPASEHGLDGRSGAPPGRRNGAREGRADGRPVRHVEGGGSADAGRSRRAGATAR